MFFDAIYCVGKFTKKSDSTGTYRTNDMHFFKKKLHFVVMSTDQVYTPII